MIRGIIVPPNVRLMLAGFLLGIVQDRRLMRGEGRPATGSRGGPEPDQSRDPLVRRVWAS
jgi:hypothetical protein